MTDIEKMDLRSMDIVEEKREKLKELFPEVFTEGQKIDFERLKLTLGEAVDVGKERYGMNWPGKADCFKIIQQPSIATLTPAREESVNFDKTENLFIEGDNLEVLKLLQKPYFGKVKMIYIDPPYNTGNDFIYPDNYSESLDTYLRYTGQIDDEGRKYSTNTEADGRFHSKWINMMYPRLFLARNLLREDGVIFLNIGEEEISNSEKMLNEIFGEENKVSIVARIAKTASNLGTHFASSIDFLLCYAKNLPSLPAFKDKVDQSLYKKIEASGHRKGEKYRDDIAFYQASQRDIRPNQKYFILCPNGSKVLPPCSIQDEIMREGDGRWRWTRETFIQKKDLIVFKETGNSPLVDQDGKKAKYNIYTKSYLSDREADGTLPRNILTDYINRKGADLIKKFNIPFDFSKPIELMIYLAEIISLKSEDIIMDFFSGSSSTAHSVIELNKLDNGNRKFIMIQLPEPTDKNSDVFKAGYKTIADIGKERIRRVIKKIQEEQAQKKDLFSSDKPKLDLGFKVFKLEPSNFKLWNDQVAKDKDAIKNQLEMFVEHINPKSSQEDILYELLLKSGFPLTTKIEQLTMTDKSVFSIDEGAMLICLEKDLTPEVIKEMAEKKPVRVVCLDEGFHGNDQLKTNAVQIMKSRDIKFRTV